MSSKAARKMSMRGTGSKRAIPTPESIHPKTARPVASGQIPNAIPLAIVQGLADRWRLHGEPTQLEWSRDSIRFLNDSTEVFALAYVSTVKKIRWVVSRNGMNTNLIGMSLSGNPDRDIAFVEAERVQNTRITPSIALFSGGPGIGYISTIFIDSGLRGYIVGNVPLNEKDNFRQSPLFAEFGVQFVDTNGAVIGEQLNTDAVDQQLVQTSQFEVLGQTWTVNA